MFSIKNKLIFLMFIISVVPLSIVGGVAVMSSMSALKDQIGKGSLEYTRMARDRVNNYLYSKYSEIRNLNKQEVLYAFFTGNFEEHISRFLPFLNKSFDDYFYISYVAKTGKVIASSDNNIVNINFSDTPGFKRALSGKDTVGSVTFLENMNGYALLFYLPITDILEPGKIMGVVTAALKWERFREMITEIKIRGKVQSEADHFMLMNKKGVVIAGTPSEEAFRQNLISLGRKSAILASRGGEGFLVDMSEHSFETFATYTSLNVFKDMPNPGWLLVLNQDVNEIFKPVTGLRNVTFMLLFVIILFLALASVFIAKKISEPLLLIIAAVDEIGKGNLEKSVAIHSKDEIGKLAGSFNNMARELKISRDELILSREYRENILRSMTDILIVLDINGNIQSMNKAAYEILEYSEDEISGKSFSQIIVRQEKHFQDVLKNLYRNGYVRNLEEVYFSRTGKPVPVIFSGSIMTDKEGEPKGIVCIALDISEKLKADENLRESEKKFRAIFESSVIGMSIVDDDGTILVTNPAIQNMFGYADEEFRSKKYIDITHPDDTEKNKTYFEEFRSGMRDHYVLEKRFYGKAGKRFWGRVTVFKIKSEEGRGLLTISMVEDITAQKLAEQERELKRSLEIRTVVLEEQNWLKSGLNQLSDVMYGHRDILKLPDKVITFLSVYLGAAAGSIYILNEQEGLMELAGHHGYGSGETLRGIIKFEEGLLGETALSGKPVFSQSLKDSKVKIKSASGDFYPKNLLLFSLIFEGVVLGVVELASLKEYGDTQKEFVLQGQAVIGAALKRVFMHIKTENLLQESRKFSEELKSKSDKLEETNRQLEFKARSLLEAQGALKERNKELENAKRELQERAVQQEQLSRYKSEFLAGMSHEIRTPLNSILLLAKVLGSKKTGQLNEVQHRHIDTIYNAGSDLLDQINNILDISKIESGEIILNYTEIKIPAFIDSLIELFQIRAEEKRIGLKAGIGKDVPGEFKSDPDRVRQILNNLLSNAIKFTQKGQVTLQVTRLVLDEAEHIMFSVKDTGIGIPDNKKNMVFEPFRQVVDGKNSPSEGTGLGLSISNDLVTMLGGTLTLESREGAGSEFSFLLPVQPLGIAKGMTGPVTSKAARFSGSVNDPDKTFKAEKFFVGKHVLIVDDDFRNTYSLGSALEMKGLVVSTKENGEEALEFLKAEPPIDLILMDIMMPKMDGYTAIQEIRKIKKFRSVPLIVLSARSLSGERAKCLLAGASDFLPKPVNWDNLFILLPLWL